MYPPRVVALLLALACRGPADDGAAPDATDTADALDTGVPEDTGPPGDPADADADGYRRWDLEPDPALADCDDTDAAVTPATERLVPAGPYERGSERFADAQPVETVEVSAFCLDVDEVTHARFLAVLLASADEGRDNADAEGRPLYDEWDDDDDVPEALARGEDGAWAVDPVFAEHPVVEVWHWGAEAYCALDGRRLPTEAEWEKAARGTDAREWPWGDEAPDCDRANVRPGGNPDPETGQGGVEPCYGGTLPVGSFPTGAGAWGHRDLAGNVAEWVADWYRADTYADPDDTDPVGPDSGWGTDDANPDGFVARVARGGNAVTVLDATRGAARTPEPEDATSNGVGFRCARPLR